jgi:poly-gamma-glutamate synthesis protein (capsule biosynthesis protein)
MIDAGADLVVGGHPHITQGVEQYKGRLIVYSLGNFVFDGFTSTEGRTGWLLSVTLGRGGAAEWEILTIMLDEQGLPHPVAGAVLRGRAQAR